MKINFDPQAHEWHKMSEGAKIIREHCGSGRNELYKFLKTKKIWDWKGIPWPRYVEQGLFYIEPKGSFNNHQNFSLWISDDGIQFVEGMLMNNKMDFNDNDPNAKYDPWEGI